MDFWFLIFFSHHACVLKSEEQTRVPGTWYAISPLNPTRFSIALPPYISGELIFTAGRGTCALGGKVVTISLVDRMTQLLFDTSGLICQNLWGLEFGSLKVSYFFTISLVFSFSELGSLIEDVSASGSCRDTIILGAANTY